MNLWEQLGIPPTTDIARIKAAYARQAKLYHPEEHPEEFKALQNAYKMAVRLAKSQRAAGQTSEMPERAAEQTSETPEMKAEQTAEMSEMKFQKTEDAEETASEPTAADDSAPKTAQQTQAKTADTDSEDAADHDFDFSGVDSYGDRELFFRQFLLLTKNPYLQNNLYTWEGFLERKEFAEMFADTDFRISFVHVLCSQRGWRRKTILYFEQYLTQFHTEENRPSDGKWETELPCFRRRRLPHLRLPAFFMDRFWDQDGDALHKKLWRQLSSSLGRELNFDMKIDVIRYMKQYLLFGEANAQNAASIERIHKNWMMHQVIWAGSLLTISLFVILALVQSMGERREYARQQEYIKELYDLDDAEQQEYINELYDLDEETCPPEELEYRRKLYSKYWQYAEERIDEALERYQAWEDFENK